MLNRQRKNSTFHAKYSTVQVAKKDQYDNFYQVGQIIQMSCTRYDKPYTHDTYVPTESGMPTFTEREN